MWHFALLFLASAAGCAGEPPALPVRSLAELGWPELPLERAAPPSPLWARAAVAGAEVSLEGAGGRLDPDLTGGFHCVWTAARAAGVDPADARQHYQWIVACRLGPSEDALLQVICPGAAGTNRAGPVVLRSPLARGEIVSLELLCGQDRS